MKICFKDGDLEDAPELEGAYTLKAKTKKRPGVFSSNSMGAHPLTEEDGLIYPGCYVNASISANFYCYTKNGGGVTATLLGVQFARDGESFASGPTMATSEDFADFDDVSDFDDDDL